MLIHSYTCELLRGPRSALSNICWRMVIAFFLVASATFVHRDIQKLCFPPDQPASSVMVEKAK